MQMKIIRRVKFPCFLFRRMRTYSLILYNIWIDDDIPSTHFNNTLKVPTLAY